MVQASKLQLLTKSKNMKLLILVFIIFYLSTTCHSFFFEQFVNQEHHEEEEDSHSKTSQTGRFTSLLNSVNIRRMSIIYMFGYKKMCQFTYRLSM